VLMPLVSHAAMASATPGHPGLPSRNSWAARTFTPSSPSIRQPDGSPDASFSNLALQIPNVFSFSSPSAPGL
jgi:hypothetical protein